MMTMRNDFCAFILTHGRPGQVITINTLRRHGYTGKIFLIIDDEDVERDRYIDKFKDIVIIFSKKDAATCVDDGDNLQGRRGVVYARNECFKIARTLGFKYFIQLDDDYKFFQMNFDNEFRYTYGKLESLDDLFCILLEYFEQIPVASICIAQGGDLIGGKATSALKSVKATRKAMNTFICSIDRPFQFFGRINEDTSTYTALGRQGILFLTINMIAVVQRNTQTNSGGMTELYLDYGTYMKSFYSVMYCPSCVSISEMGEKRRRLHHKVSWENCVPMILREDHRKSRPDQALQICAESPVSVTA